MVKYLIIGSSGYVGAAVAKDLRFAYNVGLSKNSLKYSCSFKTNIILDRNKIVDQIHKFEPEVVINSAWNSVGDYSEDVAMSNIEDQIKLFEFVRSLSKVKKVINFGSAWECPNFGSCPESEGKSDTPFLKAKKVVRDKYFEFFNNRHYWLRLFYVYGLEPKKGLVKYIADTINAKKDVRLNYPESSVDYINILDVVNAIHAFSTQHINGGVYNIGSGIATSNIAILEKVLNTLMPDDKNKIKDILNLQGEKSSEHFWADTEKSSELVWNKECRNILEDIPEIVRSILNKKKLP